MRISTRVAMFLSAFRHKYDCVCLRRRIKEQMAMLHDDGPQDTA